MVELMPRSDDKILRLRDLVVNAPSVMRFDLLESAARLKADWDWTCKTR
jgi:hypothetical protein